MAKMNNAKPENPNRPTFARTELLYQLPDELIAVAPAPRREDARLLCLNRSNAKLDDATVADLPSLLVPGDLLILNDVKVLPAKLTLWRKTGGRVPGLFVEEEAPGTWRVLLEGSGRLREGETLAFQDSAEAAPTLTLTTRMGQGQWRVRLSIAAPAEETLLEFGEPPLPPYIVKRRTPQSPAVDDRERYQTVYAKQPGAIAAPTAGLHLTQSLLEQLRSTGIETATMTLHVGVGTFTPIKTDDLAGHVMHAETYEITEECASAIEQCRHRGGRVVAVGTTAVRALESASPNPHTTRSVLPGSASTSAFIYPPYQFRCVDCLLTNFHLPGSTLLALVMAMAGVERTRTAYQHAVANRYRFFSYGDAMLIQ